MPLHLLGKKSWNVYNPENVARVQRDEAQAKAREEEDERLMQEVDAERRIKILRGESPPTPPPPPPSQPSSDPAIRPDRKAGDDTGHFRKRRRIAGEDDTDRDIRYARENAAHASVKRDELLRASRKLDKTAQAPILDAAGHINLFPAANAKSEKNAEAEAENARKKRSYEDQYTMRFSNAAGFKETIGQKPWYSSAGQDATAPGAMSEKNVWGNEDPRRQERERARINVNDPLAAMKRGVRQLKATEQERKRWNDNKRKEIESLKTDETRQSRHLKKEEAPTGITAIVEIRVETEAEIAHLVALTTGLRITAIIISLTMSARLPGIQGDLDQEPIPNGHSSTPPDSICYYDTL
ncbi:uncharacterized protein N7511_010712 [Penicillium nucicola]|uniref:uncharacterized protein n=1 Tax=Penicillium nucicola TaxID=1850975 RepID=UPI00254551A1|nr:uncharacterized protein N7511_010712 [Penicillium nucicola]KAJ5749016.1 hypothetical protein N7511_010712 [Penicillium nucicola]